MDAYKDTEMPDIAGRLKRLKLARPPRKDTMSDVSNKKIKFSRFFE